MKTLLSPRELEIIVLVAKGWCNKEIAQRLNLSIRTVETHRRNIELKIKPEIDAAAGGNDIGESRAPLLTHFAIANHLVPLLFKNDDLHVITV